MNVSMFGRELKISQGLSVEGTMSYETDYVAVSSEFGPAYTALSIESGPPYQLKVVIESGYPSITNPVKGRPFSHDGEDMGYHLSARIDHTRERGLEIGAVTVTLRKSGSPTGNPRVRWPVSSIPELEAKIADAWKSHLEGLVASESAALESFRKQAMSAFIREQNRDIMQVWNQLRTRIAHRDATRNVLRRVVTTSTPQSLDALAVNPDFRPFEDGNEETRGLDEVVSEGIAMLHAETMSDEGLWIGATLLDGRRLSFNITGTNLVMRAEIDDDPADDAA